MSDEGSDSEPGPLLADLSPAERLVIHWTSRRQRPRYRSWNPITAAMLAVVAAVICLCLGSVGTGIIFSVNTPESVRGAIQVTTEWAGSQPLLVIALLGVSVVCWYEITRWANELGRDEDEADDSVEDDWIVAHMRGVRTLSLWAAVVSLVVSITCLVFTVNALIPSGFPFQTEDIPTEIAAFLSVIIPTTVCIAISVRVDSLFRWVLGPQQPEAPAHEDETVLT